jgi:hypothetical protein
VAIPINVNGESINYPETGDTNWSDEATDFAVQTASAFGKLGLDIGTSVDIPQTLDVTGATTLDSTLTVAGTTTLNGTANLNGNTNLGNGSSDTIAVTGILNANSGVLYVDPTNSRVGINDTTPSQALDVTGNALISGTLGVTGNSTFTGDVIASIVKASGSGGLTIDSNGGTDVALFGAGGGAGTTLYGGLNGTTGNFADTTDATTSTDGALKTAGGVGIAKKLFVGTGILIGNGSAAAPSLSFSSDADNGLYYIGSNNFGIAASGVKVSDISSLGTLNGTLGTDYRNLLQTQQTTLGTVLTGTTQMPYDNTIPQITEGIEVLSRSITPQSSNSILEIDFQIIIASDASERLAAALFKVGTSNALICSFTYSLTNETKIITGKHRILSGSTSAQTFTIRAGGNQAGTRTINGTAGSQFYGGVLNTYIMIKEYL